MLLSKESATGSSTSPSRLTISIHTFIFQDIVSGRLLILDWVRMAGSSRPFATSSHECQQGGRCGERDEAERK